MHLDYGLADYVHRASSSVKFPIRFHGIRHRAGREGFRSGRGFYVFPGPAPSFYHEVKKVVIFCKVRNLFIHFYRCEITRKSVNMKARVVLADRVQ